VKRFYSTTGAIPGLYFLGLLSVAFLYYAPSVSDVFIGLPRKVIGEIRRQGMGDSYETIGSLILLSLIALGAIRTILEGSKIKPEWPFVLAAGGFGLFVLGGASQPNKLFLVFLVFMLISFAAPEWRLNEKTIRGVVIFLVAVIGASLALSLIEVVTDTAWAGYTSSSGTKIRRPSAFFYNPNVYGFWLALIGSFFSILYFRGKNEDIYAIGIVLCSIGSLLASSRSYCYLLILTVLVIAAIHRHQRRMAISCVLLVSLPIAIGCFFFLLLDALVSSQLTATLAGSAWRLLKTPFEAAAQVFGLAMAGGELPTEVVSEEFRRSYAGRFEGRALDSGVKAIFVHLSGVSLLGLLMFYSGCFLRVAKYGAARLRLFGLTTAFFVLAGLFMSYAALPLWLSWGVIVAMFQYAVLEEKKLKERLTEVALAQ